MGASIHGQLEEAVLRFIFALGVMGCLLCLGGIGHAQADGVVQPKGADSAETKGSESLEDRKKRLFQAPIKGEAQDLISFERYVAGGVTGTLVGYGIGHAVQRRWLQRGWLYTLGGVAALGVIAANACVFCDEPSDAQVYGFYALFGIRLIETVEVWFADHTPYTSTAHRGPQLSPFLGYSREEDQPTVGLSIRW